MDDRPTFGGRVMKLIAGLVSTIAEMPGKGVPSGILFLACQVEGWSLYEYQAALDIMQRAKLATVVGSGHRVTVTVTPEGMELARDINRQVLS